MPEGDPPVVTVNEHMRLENAHEFDACIDTFRRGKCDALTTGDVYDGADRVHHFLATHPKAFRDFSFQLILRAVFRNVLRR